MIDRGQAVEIAQQYLRDTEKRGVPDLVLLDEHTREEPVGWVFFYQSKEYVETKAHGSELAGNAPFVVLRDTGDIRVLGTARPVEDYLADYFPGDARVTFTNAD